MNPIIKKFQYGDATVTLETGRIARQATGAVVVTMGETTVLCTVVGAKEAVPGQGFSRCQYTIRKRPMQRVRSPVVFSSEKAVHLKKKH